MLYSSRHQYFTYEEEIGLYVRLLKLYGSQLLFICGIKLFLG